MCDQRWSWICSGRSLSQSRSSSNATPVDPAAPLWFHQPKLSGNPMMNLYGLSTCDTCKKAQKALTHAGFDVTFRDIRAEPLSAAEREEFIHEFGDQIINRQSTTWRGLNDWMKESEADAQLAAHPALMKRPVIRHGSLLTLGWDDAVLARLMEQ